MSYYDDEDRGDYDYDLFIENEIIKDLEEKDRNRNLINTSETPETFEILKHTANRHEIIN